MAYELDFIGVDEATSNADAISMRWVLNNKKAIGIYDGGLIKHGEELEKHLNSYYFNGLNDNEKIIDFIICSHSDQDHVSGLKNILEKFTVKKIYMNRPWLYAKEIYEKAVDKKKTEDLICKELKESYPFIYALEEIALEKGIEILNAFEGTVIENNLKVLSPSLDFYLAQLYDSDKTAVCNESANQTQPFFNKIKEAAINLFESMDIEMLKEESETSSENEMSVIIYGDMEVEKFLLTGDVGIKGLTNALHYAKKLNISLKDEVFLYQIPHHGGRHNVSPTILNKIVGEKTSLSRNKIAVTCVGKETEYPKKMVVNAFIRRGVEVYAAKGSTLTRNIGMPNRNWGSVSPYEFSDYVEEWND